MTREQIHIWLDSELLNKFDDKINGFTRTVIVQKLIEGFVKGKFEVKVE